MGTALAPKTLGCSKRCESKPTLGGLGKTGMLEAVESMVVILGAGAGEDRARGLRLNIL